ncbi:MULTISPECIES: DUF6710 family protein [Paenibacillus]|uniref:Uncharacterized protein n=1 Tax=Paenibacillus vandeheii TaxID=3035917 RepID=A0ABT8JHM0_9BACL|nr:MULTISPECIES: DUF6710 family protein [Paenibacillus]KGP77458.1 hypothetical protein P363_0133355 [Paenibacillus sp. MAEPY1]KGP78397.1 hypothetical protein P364_0128550 [Paenibacillus sp. MAEPY2]MDN4604051.1 hypothetical protein [Paenibacillus vandeheii]
MFKRKREDTRKLEQELQQREEASKLKQENKQREEFENILSLAREILNTPTDYKYGDTHPIYILIKGLVNQEFYKNVYRSVSTHDDAKVFTVGINKILPNPGSRSKRTHYISVDEGEKYLYKTSLSHSVSFHTMLERSRVSGQRISEIIQTSGKEVLINLGEDPVLTRPWHIDRLLRAFLCIGENKEYGDWTQDDNHRLELWLPFGVTFVNSGNHSITTGILNNEGQIKLDLDEIYRMENEVFHNISCDGVNYTRVVDNSHLAPVTNLALAAVFEIGKLINKNEYQRKIRFKGIDVN